MWESLAAAVRGRSSGRGGVAEQLSQALCLVLGTDEVPVRLRAWDGSEAGPVGAPVVVVRSRRALRRLAWAPGELGLGRAYVAGEIDVEGDLFAALAAFTGLTSAGRPEGAPAAFSARDRLRLAAIAARLGALGPEPAPPPEEIDLGPRGRRHSKGRDAAAISHHYDVGNTFYRLVLGPSMVYSCAVWADEDTGLDAAQEAKLDLVCRKLGLEPGMRLLDVGCGWGSLALHAAERYGVDVVGVTLSIEQATLARKRVAEAGLTDRVDIRVQDYRDIDDGPFDAISSIGMAEHVGRHQMAAYTARLHDLLRPGGRLLNHAIAWSGGATTWDNDDLHQPVRLPRRGAAPARGDGQRDRGERPGGPRRRGAAPALRADAAGVDAPARGELGRRGGGDERGPGPGVAAVHGRLGDVVRGRRARRQPGPGPATGRRPAAAAPRRLDLSDGFGVARASLGADS